MSGLLFLTSDDFSVQNGTKGKILCNPIPGFSLVLFYSTHCKHCRILIPIFKRLPGTIGGCHFGMLNVGTNKKTIQDSKQTVTKLEYVPLIILYVNGKPFMRYAGKYDKDDITKFVVSMSKRVQNKQTFSGKKDPNIKEDPRGGIPAFSIGKPLHGDGRKEVSYLEFEKAYIKTLTERKPNRGRNVALPKESGMGTPNPGMMGMRRH